MTISVNPNLSATAARNMSPEQFEEHRAREQARRDEFRSQFPSVASAVESSIISQLPPGTNAGEVIIDVRGRNEEEDEKLSEVRKVHRRMAEVGTIPASIIWLHPWPGQASGRYLMYGDMTVEACPIGQSFSQKIIRNYKIDLEDKGGRFGADVITPIALANDYVQQFFPQKQGGCFQYMGDHLPGEKKDTRDREMKAWDKAKKEQLAEYRRRYREAEGFFQQGGRGGLKNITENHRLIAMWLHHYRYVPVLPGWVTASREPGEIPDSCPRCGADISEAGFACGACGTIINPFAAYMAGEIEDDHHSLRRLTREQLNELGLDYVPTLEEYRAQRRKDAEEGRAEPSSTATVGVSVKRGNKGGRKTHEQSLAEQAIAKLEKDDD